MLFTDVCWNAPGLLGNFFHCNITIWQSIARSGVWPINRGRFSFVCWPIIEIYLCMMTNQWTLSLLVETPLGAVISKPAYNEANITRCWRSVLSNQCGRILSSCNTIAAPLLTNSDSIPQKSWWHWPIRALYPYIYNQVNLCDPVQLCFDTF